MVPITDLVVKDDDLVVATQGRSFWILDDISPLRQISKTTASATAHLYKPGIAHRFFGLSFPLPNRGQNPRSGALFYYSLKSDLKEGEEISLEVLDSGGKLVRKFSSKPDPDKKAGGGFLAEFFGITAPPDQLPAKAGLNRFAWDLRYPEASSFDGMILWGGGTDGPVAVPATYQAKLVAAGQTLTESFEVKKDPRLEVTQADLQKQFDLQMKVRDKLTATHDADQAHPQRARSAHLRHRSGQGHSGREGGGRRGRRAQEEAHDGGGSALPDQEQVEPGPPQLPDPPQQQAGGAFGRGGQRRRGPHGAEPRRVRGPREQDRQGAALAPGRARPGRARLREAREGPGRSRHRHPGRQEVAARSQVRVAMALALGAASVLSGLAALVYQVLWSRQLALVLGTSTEAVAIVLSSFMAGLGLGNALAARALERHRVTIRPWLPRLYAALEGAVALSALLLPWAFAQAPALLRPLYGEGGSGAFRAARLAFAFLLLVLPTTAMGATLPVLVALARPPRGRAASAAGALYAANTVGAVGGALATPLLLLPALGITRAALVAVAANVAAGLFALAAPTMAPEEPRPAPASRTGAPRQATSVRLALAVSFLSGLGALAHETAWTRALVLLIGPTAYAFAFVVAAVIAGLAAGSALCARVADRLRRPALALALVQAGIVACALAIVPLIGVLPVPIGETTRALADQPGRLLVREGLGTLLMLFLPSALFGASFPLAVRMLADEGRPPGAAVGRVLGWNTLGAGLGPLLAAFVLLPSFGLQVALQVAAAVHALAAILALAAANGPARSWALRAAVLLPALGLGVLPPWDQELLAGGAYRYGHLDEPGELRERLRAGTLLYYRDGAAATVSVKRLGNSRALAVDGKVDATNTADMPTQGLIAHLPLLLHGSAREALVVGLGSGATAAAALVHSLDHLEVVEISPEVVEAARRHFADVQRGALDDPRLRLRVTDARHHLQLTPRRFDVIVSEPSNPWMAGVASLFTREFFTLARERLREGGLFCQWMHVYGMAAEDVRTVVGGFADVFPESGLFQVTEGDLLLVGAAGAWPTPSRAEIASRMEAPRVAEDLRRVGLTRPGALGTLFVLGPGRLAAFAGEAPRHTDDRPILELRAARSMLANTSGENRRALLAAGAGPPVEPWASLRAAATPEDLVERGRLLERSTSLALALEAYATALRLDPRHTAAQEGLARIGAVSAALPLVEGLLKALADGPDPLGARVSLARLYRAQGRFEEATSEIVTVLARDAQNVRALKLMAALQGDRGEAAMAFLAAARAFSLAEDDAEAAALLASASLLSGEAPAALERSEDALALDPGHELALRVRALALARLQKPVETRAAFEVLLEKDGGSWQSWAHYGAFLADTGDHGAAARALQEAADLAPDRPEAWKGLLEAARLQGNVALVSRAEAALRRLGAP